MMNTQNRKIGKSLPKTIGYILLSVLIYGCASTNPEVRFTSTPTALNGSVSSQSAYVIGKRHLASGRYGLAIESFSFALAKSPQSVKVLNAAAVAYDLIGRHDVAKQYYERALRIDQNSMQTLNNFGYSLLLQKQHAEASALLQRARSVSDGDTHASTVTANLALARGNGTPPTTATYKMVEKNETKAVAGIPSSTRKNAWIEPTGIREAFLHTRPDSSAIPSMVAALAETDEPIVSLFNKVSVAFETNPSMSGTPLVLTAAQMNADPSTSALSTKRPREKKPIVELSNGAGRNKLAARMRFHLGGQGIPVSLLTNANHFSYRKTMILYDKAHAHYANYLAQRLPIQVTMQEVTGQYANVKVILGGDILEFDRNLIATRRSI